MTPAQAAFAAELAAMPDHRFSRLSREEVARMREQADQAARMRAYCAEVVTRAVDEMMAGKGLTETVDRALNSEAVVVGWKECWCGESVGQPWPSLPVPAYLAPVRRWAGGPPELDAWYWDRNSF